MKTIEDKLRIAHELGRIAGAAECIEDEGTRDTIYGASESLFDRLLTEAAEEERDLLPALKLIQKAEYEAAAEKAYAPRQSSPPDPFDFVETGEMVEKEPEPKKETNFDRLTKSPETLAEFLGAQPYCSIGVNDGCDEHCTPCVLNWLNEEAKDG